MRAFIRQLLQQVAGPSHETEDGKSLRLYRFHDFMHSGTGTNATRQFPPEEAKDGKSSFFPFLM
jgi:hypothetical protein